MADLSLFLFAKIYKIFENFVRPDQYLQHQWIFCCDTLHMHFLQPSYESCEVLPDQFHNSRLIIIFVCSNWQNIWKCCLSGWIPPTPSCEVLSGSNSKWPTYRHFCLLKLTKYLKKLSVQMYISLHQWTFFSDTLHMHSLQSSNESCEVSSGSNSKWLTYRHFLSTYDSGGDIALHMCVCASVRLVKVF